MSFRRIDPKYAIRNGTQAVPYRPLVGTVVLDGPFLQIHAPKSLPLWGKGDRVAVDEGGTFLVYTYLGRIRTKENLIRQPCGLPPSPKGKAK